MAEKLFAAPRSLLPANTWTNSFPGGGYVYKKPNLTDELDSFVLAKVKSGRYENASELVRAALRALEREEQEYEARLSGLRNAIDEGDASGIAERNILCTRSPEAQTCQYSALALAEVCGDR